jgi:hypothetical protein
MDNEKVNVGNAKHAFEYLTLINDASTEEEKIGLLRKWGGTPPLNMLLPLNWNKNVVLDLPEGAPPYKQDQSTHPDMMTNLASQIGRLKICVKQNDVKKRDKERVFIQVLEQVPYRDAEVLLAAKDRQLEELYPNITPELVAKVFPNYVA